MEKCAVCHRKALAGKKYCLHHDQALSSLAEHYKAWVAAYGGISWNDFMAKLQNMQETGKWVKEVIEKERG